MVIGLICTCELYKVCSHLRRRDIEIYQGHRSLSFARQLKVRWGREKKRKAGGRKRKNVIAMVAQSSYSAESVLVYANRDTLPVPILCLVFIYFRGYTPLPL